MAKHEFDLLIVGGGINGVGIARDAAGRGLKVLLCEKDDLASHTSSASSKLIHGGLRYLEHYEFRLVRESLNERERLLKISPHLVWPMRIVLPVLKGMRPAWLLRLGLFLYDNLVRRSALPGTKRLNLRKAEQGRPLKSELVTGFEYSDCWADDARLVVLNAVDARQRGAEIMTRTECTDLERGPDGWTAQLESSTGEIRKIDARIVVNAAGPWVDQVAMCAGHNSKDAGVRLVKGSHIVTRQLYAGDHGYIFQAADGRVIFAMPYEGRFTLVGTTDVDMVSPDDSVEISEEETRYLCDAVNSYFAVPISSDEVLWSYAGVRPLFDDKSASASVVTRDYVFDLSDGDGREAPLLSIYGGKLTTFRKLAEHAMARLKPFLPESGEDWTDSKPLPGGDFRFEERSDEIGKFQEDHPWLDAASAARLFESYGTRAREIVGGAKTGAELGKNFGGSLYEAEVRYLIDNEFAQTAEDVLWRRSKLGLHLDREQVTALENWIAECAELLVGDEEMRPASCAVWKKGKA